MSTIYKSSSIRIRVALVGVAIAGLVFAAGCGTEPSSGSGGSSYTPTGSNTAVDDLNDDYFDGCSWADGCGMDPNAFSGSDSNSLTGDDDINSLYP